MDANNDKQTNYIGPFDPERCNELLEHLTGWDIESHGGLMQLVKRYTFDNFANAMLFTNQVANAAESESHHPSICIEWGSVTIRWWTHKVQGLSEMDFVMAARCDELHEA